MNRFGNQTKNGADDAALPEHVASAAAHAFDGERQIDIGMLVDEPALFIAERAAGESSSEIRRENRQRKTDEITVDADTGRRADGQVQIRAAAIDGDFEQRGKRHCVSLTTSSTVVSPS